MVNGKLSSATDHELIIGILGALSLHPAMRNPPVFYPPINGRQRKQVFVDKYRDYGGAELIEQGLTIAVYPSHTDYGLLSDGQSGTPESSSRNKFADIDSYTLGKGNDLSYKDQSKKRLVVQILFTDAAFDRPYDLTYGVKPLKRIEQLYEVYGNKFYSPVDNQDSLPGWDEDTQTVTIRTNPAEIVVRDYTYLVRNVLREIHNLKPYGVKQITVDSVDYPSSSWLNRNSNLVFHSSYIIITCDTFESPAAKDPYYIAPDWAKDISTQPDYAEDAKDFYDNIPDSGPSYPPGTSPNSPAPPNTGSPYPGSEDPIFPGFPYYPLLPPNPQEAFRGVTNIQVNDDKWNETNIDFYPTVERFLDRVVIEDEDSLTFDPSY